MSWLSDSTELVPGGWLASTVAGHGVLGSIIRTVTVTGDNGPGYLYKCLDGTQDDAKEIRGYVSTKPSTGTFYSYEDGSFSWTAPSIGAQDQFVVDLYEDGVSKGSFNVKLNSTDNTAFELTQLQPFGFSSTAVVGDISNANQSTTLSSLVFASDSNAVISAINSLLLGNLSSQSQGNLLAQADQSTILDGFVSYMSDAIVSNGDINSILDNILSSTLSNVEISSSSNTNLSSFGFSTQATNTAVPISNASSLQILGSIQIYSTAKVINHASFSNLVLGDIVSSTTSSNTNLPIQFSLLIRNMNFKVGQTVSNIVFSRNFSYGKNNTYSVSGGSLPIGLSIDPTSGALLGTPAVESINKGLIVVGTDALGNQAQSNSFMMNVLDPAAHPPVLLGPISSIVLNLNEFLNGMDLSGYFFSPFPGTLSMQSSAPMFTMTQYGKVYGKADREGKYIASVTFTSETGQKVTSNTFDIVISGNTIPQGTASFSPGAVSSNSIRGIGGNSEESGDNNGKKKKNQ